MKKLVWKMLIFGLVGITQVCFGKIYSWKSSKLVISGSAPPALLYVTDFNGNRTGPNPAASVNSIGEQPGSPFGLNEIANSFSEQTNLGLGDINTSNFHSNSHTMWDIDIFDGGKQTYTINAKGVTTGIQEIAIIGLIKAGGNAVKAPKEVLSILVDSGITRQISLTFDPVQGTVFTQPIVGNGDLLTDVKTACKLNLITSDRVCDRLEKLAATIQDALDHHHYEEAERLVWIFLHNLGDSRPEGCKDDDDHGAIKESALTILKGDAKALLTQIEQDERKNHH